MVCSCTSITVVSSGIVLEFKMSNVRSVSFCGGISKLELGSLGLTDGFSSAYIKLFIFKEEKVSQLF